MENHLTYQWLTPILVSIIAFAVGVIGIMIRNYMASIDHSIRDIKLDLIKHVEKVEKFITDINGKHTEVDKRVTIIEHDIIACGDCSNFSRSKRNNGG